MSQKKNKPEWFESQSREVGEASLTDLIENLERELGEGPGSVQSIKEVVEQFQCYIKPILANAPKTRLDLSLAFFEMGLVEAAREMAMTVESQDPFYLEAQYLLGHYFVAEHNHLAALGVYQRILREKPKPGEFRWEAVYQLARTYLALGNRAKANEQLDLLEKERPRYRDAHILREKAKAK